MPHAEGVANCEKAIWCGIGAEMRMKRTSVGRWRGSLRESPVGDWLGVDRERSLPPRHWWDREMG